MQKYEPQLTYDASNTVNNVLDELSTFDGTVIDEIAMLSAVIAEVQYRLDTAIVKLQRSEEIV